MDDVRRGLRHDAAEATKRDGFLGNTFIYRLQAKRCDAADLARTSVEVVDRSTYEIAAYGARLVRAVEEARRGMEGSNLASDLARSQLAYRGEVSRGLGSLVAEDGSPMPHGYGFPFDPTTWKTKAQELRAMGALVPDTGDALSSALADRARAVRLVIEKSTEVSVLDLEISRAQKELERDLGKLADGTYRARLVGRFAALHLDMSWKDVWSALLNEGLPISDHHAGWEALAAFVRRQLGTAAPEKLRAHFGLAPLPRNGPFPVLYRDIVDADLKLAVAALPTGKGKPGAKGKDNLQFVRALIWRAEHGKPWNQLPTELGSHERHGRRYRDLQRSGRLVEVVSASGIDILERLLPGA